MAKKKMQIDFTGVEKEIRKGGKAARLPEDDYLFKVVGHEVRKNKGGDGRHIAWRMQVAKGQFKGKTVYHTTSLKPQALWNLRNLIHACIGKNVAGKAVNFDPESLYGKVFAATAVDDEPYEGKIKSVLEDLRPKEELGSEESDEDDEDEDDSDEEEDSDDSDDDEDLEDVEVEDL